MNESEATRGIQSVAQARWRGQSKCDRLKGATSQLFLTLAFTFSVTKVLTQSSSKGLLGLFFFFFLAIYSGCSVCVCVFAPVFWFLLFFICFKLLLFALGSLFCFCVVSVCLSKNFRFLSAQRLARRVWLVYCHCSKLTASRLVTADKDRGCNRRQAGVSTDTEIM